MKDEELISIGKAAKLLGVSIQTLRRWDEKGVLKPVRAGARGKRFYRGQDINFFTKDLPTIGWKWASSSAPNQAPDEFYCQFSDVFIARLRRLENDLKGMNDLSIHYALLLSMAGEIGDNSYAHNAGNWPDISGIFFAYDLSKRTILLADRGRGILATLKTVRPELASHAEALRVAFTEVVSGRFPERRGNGLKFVTDTVLKSNVALQFRTGNAQLDLQKDDDLKKLRISECEAFHGCFAILQF